jgi:large subunit ribosomal protein L25
MQENFQIDAVIRDTQGKGASRRLRHTGLVPGIIYGGDQAPQMIATAHNKLLQHLENEAFYSRILTVKVGDTEQRVVLKDLQRHPAKPFVQHFDLLRVAATDRIKMNVPLHFINESKAPGIKAGGIANHALTDIEIICAAQDLPEYIEVDLSGLQAGESIHLSELNLPAGVEIPAIAQDGHDVSVVAIHMPKAAVTEEETEGAASEDGTPKE